MKTARRVGVAAAASAALLAHPAIAAAAIESVVLTNVTGGEDSITGTITVTPDDTFSDTVNCIIVAVADESNVDGTTVNFGPPTPLGVQVSEFTISPLPPNVYSVAADCEDGVNSLPAISNIVTGIEVGTADPEPVPNGFLASIELFFGSS
ncbi:hypothetical protein ONR57_07655 [Hoyosella sp. YIM 151337]|uniref:hypothetical protein n=1 Tax=Hoyosella sp. YIM 151337 TaxID=2992742 RepID=UPI002235B4CA|nr:hypothetical protein [Hoyosella sp. YIM 151337]MCW4353171.1 hypothetical protein [Hoyosella sp. YIM 151337]